jgi:hypothetical protein
MAITDPVMLKCTNLDGLIKQRGDVVEEEKALWAAMGCEEKLKGLYTQWKQHSDATSGQCEELREEANIEVGVDWGFATSAVKRKWKELLCDCHYTAGWSDACLHGKPPTVHATTTSAGIERAVAARLEHEKILLPAAGEGQAMIAIVLGTTSRGFRWSKLDETPLIKIMLASLERCLEKGFAYRVYAGFDAGDLFYDDDGRRRELAQWFETHISQKAAARGVTTRFATLKFLNVLRKPGPIFNFLTASAFSDGADYVYRINDDTEFRTPFSRFRV